MFYLSAIAIPFSRRHKEREAIELARAASVPSSPALPLKGLQLSTGPHLDLCKVVFELAEVDFLLKPIKCYRLVKVPML